MRFGTLCPRVPGPAATACAPTTTFGYGDVSGSRSGADNGVADGAVIGRGDVLAAVERLVQDAGQDAAAIVLSGEAGIGKSTVWEAGLVLIPSDRRVLIARPAQSEATLAFAGLMDLLEPVLEDALSSLPSPQARAIQVALQQVEADAPADRHVIQRGVLGVLRALAERGPLVVAIDDVQWLDNPSAAALTFALRRLRELPVRVLASVRERHVDPLDLEGIWPGRVGRQRLGPLELDDLYAVIELRLGVLVPPPTLRRIHHTSAGNPFYAVELARSLPSRKGRVLAERVALPNSLLDLVSDRLRALPAQTLPVVAAAGALSEPRLSVLEEFSPGAADALRPAEDTHIIQFDGDRVRFTHPLLASGALALLGPSEQRVLHRRLASVAPSAQARALHLALGTSEADIQAAEALEVAGGEALERGAPHTAGELFEHAARLTPEHAGAERNRRLRVAAGHYLVAGEIQRGRSILTGLEADVPAGPERAAVLLLLADTDENLDEAAERCARAREEAVGDDVCRAEAFRLSSEFTMLAGKVPQALELAREATRVARGAGDAVLLVRCLGTQSHFETYQGQITEGLLEHAVALEEATPGTGQHYSPTQIMGLRLMYSDRLDEGRQLLTRILRRTEEAGDDLERTNLLLHLTQLEIRAGRWSEARQMSNAALALDRQLGVQTDSRLFLQALVAAHLGREDEARDAARTAMGLGTQIHALWMLMSRWALGLLELSLGNADAAAEQLGSLPTLLAESGYRNPGVRPVLPDAIEALIGVGRMDEARQWTDELAARGDELGNPWAIATAARCRGLICAADGDVDTARNHLHDALMAHSRSPNAFEYARTVLALGIVERRAKQWRTARDTLTDALERFDALGAALWSERTVTEMARIQGRRVAAGLTETEHQVAQLVARGLPNKDVAAALHVSVRAIESNLSKVYAKLGIRSRTELAARYTTESDSIA